MCNVQCAVCSVQCAVYSIVEIVKHLPKSVECWAEFDCQCNVMMDLLISVDPHTAEIAPLCKTAQHRL